MESSNRVSRKNDFFGVAAAGFGNTFCVFLLQVSTSFFKQSGHFGHQTLQFLPAAAFLTLRRMEHYE